METGIMSEQAKKLAQALRSLSTGVDAYRAVADAAAELDRLADLCEVLTAERDTARSATASMLRRRDTVANELRCQCQALAAERDTMRAQVTTLAAERDDRAALVGKLREEAGRLGKELDYTKVLAATAEDGVKILSRALEQSRQELATLCEDRDALAEGVRVYRKVVAWSGDGASAERFAVLDAMQKWERQHGHRADVKKEPARVVTTPKPTPQPEPYRAGLPALALRRAHKEWDASDGCTLRFIEANRYEVIGRYQDKIETWGAIDLRPHAATWAEVELNAARLLGSENCNACPCEDCTHRYHMPFLRRELGITDPTRDMTALWAAFREGQRAS